MGVVKHRPKVTLLVRREIEPGETVHGRLLIDAKRDVRVNGVSVVVRGELRNANGDASGIVSLRAEPLGPDNLRAGRTELSFLFTLPQWAPSTYSGRMFSVRYTATVVIDVPWWPDRRAAFELNVAERRIDAPDPEPVLVSTHPPGPVANEPHVEVSLANRHVAQGDVLAGAVALGNVAFNRFDAIELRLVATERSDHVTWPRAAEAHAYSLTIPVTEPREGEPIDFRLRVPKDAPVSRRSLGGYFVDWHLRVRARLGWRSDVVVPIALTVLPRAFAKPLSDNRAAVPSVGSDRAIKAWTAAAERHGLAFVDDTLHGSIAGTTVTIRRDHRGRGGIYLVAELAYPTLGLDLSIVPASLLGPSARDGVQLGHASWDDAHRATSRDLGQLERAARLLGNALARAVNVQMDDTRARLERATSGVDRKTLVAFADMAALLARSLPDVRTAAGPPTAARDTVDDWRALAAELGGALRETDLHVSAQVLGCDVEVRTHLDRKATPRGATVVVHKELRDHGVVIWMPETPMGAGVLGPAARDAFDRATRDARSIRIGDRGVTAHYDRRPTANQIRALVQLAVHQSSADAPYR